MFEKLLRRKSKLSLTIDLIIILLAILIMIPATRKGTIAMVLKPTLFVYQPTLLNEPVELTQTSGDWRLRTMSGDTCTLASLTGKPIVLNYWASWCAPCLAEMSQFRSLYETYADKVNFLFISNEKPADIRQFVKRKKPGIPVYLPVSNYPEQLSTSTLPTTFVIDSNGRIVMRKEGMAQWSGPKMRNILNQLTAKNQK